MRRWTRPLPTEPDRAILSNVWTTSTCYKPREIERCILSRVYTRKDRFPRREFCHEILHRHPRQDEGQFPSRRAHGAGVLGSIRRVRGGGDTVPCGGARRAYQPAGGESLLFYVRPQ